MVQSFWMAGFECSTHRRADGKRLDLIAATAHDRFAAPDYRRCAAYGLGGARDGLRWHLIESQPRRYDWSSWLPMLDAAQQAGLEVVWDLFHYGCPDFYVPGEENFPSAFAAYAAAAAETHLRHTGRPIRAVPLNEISYFTWAVRTGYFPRQGPELPPGQLKRQLVRAAIAGARAIRSVSPEARFLWAEPLIYVAPHDRSEQQIAGARAHTESQFEAYDMLTGRTAPELGGHHAMVDAIGVNYYPANQWYWQGSAIPLGHHDYQPVSDLLVDVWQRYRKPIFLSETGSEGSARPAWLHYVCDEVRSAMLAGVRIEAICLYPILDYPGWDDERICGVGLWSEAATSGERSASEPLLLELQRQQQLFSQISAAQPTERPAAVAG